MHGPMGALHAYATRLTGKELNVLLRAHRRKTSRKGKATNSGEEVPPNSLTEAFAHPTRGEMWHKAALTEFEGLTTVQSGLPFPTFFLRGS